MMSMRVKSLHIYPVKSGQGVDLQSAQARSRGLRGDRRYMLVDSQGGFITQRQVPKLAQLSVQIIADGLIVSAPDLPELFIRTPPENTRKTVNVWRSTVDAALGDAQANTHLSSWLGMPVSLIYMDTRSERAANPKWTAKPYQVSFADGYPVLITNTASLAVLNAHIVSHGHDAVPMTRFRPNIVIDSTQAWGEDIWSALRIGEALFDLVKPCTRCVMTTLDQVTGAKDGREPLHSLRTLRTSKDPQNEGVVFGMNAVVRVGGSLSIDDVVEII